MSTVASSLSGRRVTARQLQVLRLIYDFTEAHGCPPALREIGARMGIRSTNGVNDHLVALERRGLIERDQKKARRIRVTVDGLILLGERAGEGAPGVDVEGLSRENSRMRMLLKATVQASMLDLPIILNQIRAELGGAA